MRFHHLFIGVVLILCNPFPLSATISEKDRQTLDGILGSTGIYTSSEDAYRATFSRGDVKVAVGNEMLSSFLGLASWAAVTSDPHHGGALLLAEFALFEDEVNPVISAALENRLEITALQNHFLFESPRVLFLDASATGTPQELATRVRRILDEIKTIRARNPVPVSQVRRRTVLERNTIDARVLDSILETHGDTAQGVYKASMGMAGLVHGILVGKQMGVATSITFAGSNEKATVAGQIVMTAEQIQNVLQALRRAGLDITAIQRRMSDDRPDFFFVSFWGHGRAAILAQGLRLALETQLPRGALKLSSQQSSGRL